MTSQANGRLECPPHNQIPELHDHGAVPGVEREVTRLDELRCLIRWRCRDDPFTDPDDDGTFAPRPEFVEAIRDDVYARPASSDRGEDP